MKYLLLLLCIVSLPVFGQDRKHKPQKDSLIIYPSCYQKATPPNDTIYIVAQQMPKFHGDFNKYLYDNITYSDSTIPNKIYVSFIIEKDGSLSNITILRSSSVPSLDKEVLRVISSSPKWSPGMQWGRPVRVRYYLPIIIDVR